MSGFIIIGYCILLPITLGILQHYFNFSINSEEDDEKESVQKDNEKKSEQKEDDDESGQEDDQKESGKEDEDEGAVSLHEVLEFSLSFLSITNSGRTKFTLLNRLVSTYFNFVFYTIILLAIIGICNLSPESVTISLPDFDDDIPFWEEVREQAHMVWSELAIVHNIFSLNLAIGLTILCGAAPLLVDVLLAWFCRDDES